MQFHLMESHYESIQEQMQHMEYCQQIIDGQMKEIMDKKVVSEGMAAVYLEGLRKEYDRICAGIYCNDWRVEKVLYCQSRMARSQEIDVECSFLEYDRGVIPEDDLTGILFWLFNYGIRANHGLEVGREKNLSYKQLCSGVKTCNGTLVPERLKDGIQFTIVMKRAA